jgi:hypothetical protein
MHLGTDIYSNVALLLTMAYLLAAKSTVARVHA